MIAIGLQFAFFARLDECLQILVDTNRLPEAAFFARTYLPSKVPAIVKLWKEGLSRTNPKAADALADPTDYENLFPGFKETLRTEQYLQSKKRSNIPARNYPNVKVSREKEVSLFYGADDSVCIHCSRTTYADRSRK
jgi:coatomer subunit beta'